MQVNFQKNIAVWEMGLTLILPQPYTETFSQVRGKYETNYR